MEQNGSNASEIAQLQQQIASMQQRLNELSAQQAGNAAQAPGATPSVANSENASKTGTTQAQTSVNSQMPLEVAQPGNTATAQVDDVSLAHAYAAAVSAQAAAAAVVDEPICTTPVAAQAQRVATAQNQPIVEANWTVEQTSATQADQAFPTKQANATQAQPQQQQQANDQHSWQGYYQNAQAYYSQASYQAPYQQSYAHAKDHVVAGLLAIFLGAFGIHKFYLGYNSAGFILLGVTIIGGLFTFGMAAGVVWIISLIEGILYLTKDPSEFQSLYVANRREWF